jgi:two-component system, chemotaxis family, protein-glutamate methylesterase/glutaminase
MNNNSNNKNSEPDSPHSALRTPHSIRVLLVDDSLLTVTLLKRALATAPDIEVVGTATNGREALELIPKLDPVVVCTDIHMPVMDGLELTGRIMEKYPRPILVLSFSVFEGSLNVFKLLSAGALDFVSKPPIESDSAYISIAGELIGKIRILSGVRVFRRIARERTEPLHPILPKPVLKIRAPVRIIVIGASTGGPPAIKTILSRLPPHFPLPIVCVQHISRGFQEGLVQWLTVICNLKVAVAWEGGTPAPGTVYFPREGSHLKFDRGGRFVITFEPPFQGHRPSITVTMRSAAESYGSGAAGILLTGMGSDGAEGMREIAGCGGVTIAQDEKSSIVFGMAKQAIEMGAAQLVLPLNEIAEAVLNMQNENHNGRGDCHE